MLDGLFVCPLHARPAHHLCKRQSSVCVYAAIISKLYIKLQLILWLTEFVAQQVFAPSSLGYYSFSHNEAQKSEDHVACT